METKEYTSIKHWSEEDRPREKVLKRGIDSITDSELIAILLGTGTRKLSAIDLGKKMLEEFSDLKTLARADVDDLKKINGIGSAKAITIVSAFELARRKDQGKQKKFRVTSSNALAAYVKPILQDLEREVFYVIYMNRNNEIIKEQKLFQGGVSSSVVDPKVIFKQALSLLASALVVCHNHPSGNLNPSQADKSITKKLNEGAKLFDIRLLDHIIISSQGYFSFADEGLI